MAFLNPVTPSGHSWLSPAPSRRMGQEVSSLCPVPSGRRRSVASFRLTEAAVSRLEAELRKQEWRHPRLSEPDPAADIRFDPVTGSSPTGEAFASPGAPLPQPQWVRPAPRRRRAHGLRTSLYALAALLIATPVAHQYSVRGSLLGAPAMPKPELTLQPVTAPVASNQSKPTAPLAAAASQRTTRSDAVISVEAPSGSAPPAVAPDRPATAVTRKLDPDDIKFLVAKGQQFIALRDFASARLVFQRAAEAGDAAAALALAATYDPVVLAKLGSPAPAADLDKARAFYEMAQALGSAEASRRLKHLAKR